MTGIALAIEEPVELARRCLAGDAAAVREFVEYFERQVLALCLRMLGHRQDAEDAAQESLIRAVRYLKNWDESQPVTPWVMKIAANRCRTALGKRTRVPIPGEAAGETLVARKSSNPTLGEELQLAIEELNPNYQRCFELFYLRELSVAEVAEAMAVPEGTVKTWLHRSRKQLIDHLKERGVHPDQDS